MATQNGNRTVDHLGDWRDWCRSLQTFFGLSDSHRRLISDAFDEGLVDSYAVKITEKFEEAREQLALTQETLAVRLGCSRAALAHWPRPGSPLWLLLRHSIVLGLDLSEIDGPPFRLLFDSYWRAFQSLKNDAFLEVSKRCLNDPDALARLAARMHPLDVVTLLVTLGHAHDQETLSEPAELLRSLAINVRRELYLITDKIKQAVTRLSRKELTELPIDPKHVEQTLREFFYPMLIVMSVMHYERWEND